MHTHGIATDTRTLRRVLPAVLPTQAMRCRRSFDDRRHSLSCAVLPSRSQCPAIPLGLLFRSWHPQSLQPPRRILSNQFRNPSHRIRPHRCMSMCGHPTLLPCIRRHWCTARNLSLPALNAESEPCCSRLPLHRSLQRPASSTRQRGGGSYQSMSSLHLTLLAIESSSAPLISISLRL